MGAQIWQLFQKGDSRQVKSKVPQIWQLFIFGGGGGGVVGGGGGRGILGKGNPKSLQIWQLFIGRGGILGKSNPKSLKSDNFSFSGVGVVGWWGWGWEGYSGQSKSKVPQIWQLFIGRGGILGKSNPKSLKSDNLTIFSLGGGRF